jgi:hypothetical protein
VCSLPARASCPVCWLCCNKFFSFLIQNMLCTILKKWASWGIRTKVKALSHNNRCVLHHGFIKYIWLDD